MSLIDQVSADLKTAMLARDPARTTAVRMIRAAIIELQKDGLGEVTDARVVESLRRLKKQREESIITYDNAGREDLAAQERLELGVIDAYLPTLASEETTLGWVREAIASSGAAGPKEMGKAMGALMKDHKLQVDATLARVLLQRELGAGS